MARPTIHDVTRLAQVSIKTVSAGMPFPAFLDAVATSGDHGGASGFIAGRVYWQEAVAMTGTARQEFLATVGRPRLEQSIAAMAGQAQPWDRAGQPTR